ncbi:MAG: hypothetical protein PWQ22_1035 [Archaeoglobaceae archaeon]|nr:hypothetical protein [Archaeoglobaceae archaeon]
MKHLTIRFAWHDNKWNGKICKDPSNNDYCRGNYSLLSPRIQRRINLDFENNNKGVEISKIVDKYLPPCYWVINAMGEEKCMIRDPHPFKDISEEEDPRWKQVYLEDTLEPFSVFTWCFKLGFADKGYERYPPPPELKLRTESYLSEIIPHKSIAFFYANYDNPVNGDDRNDLNRKYLLLGAGLVESVSFPYDYPIPKDLLEEVRSKKGMRNFPIQSWQFKVKLIPETVFFLPYHEYIEWIEKNSSINPEEKWKKLEEITVSIDDPNLIPHFKYVSMHLPNDKAIYLLYLIKKAINKIKDHGIVPYEEIKSIEDKVERLLEIAWNNRTEFPGFRNLLFTLLKLHQLSVSNQKIYEFINWISTNYGLEKFVRELENIKEKDCPKEYSDILDILKQEKDKVEFLSRFDFTQKQFENILKDLINKKGFETIKKNPYLLFECYNYDFVDNWNSDDTDYGISLYQIDIALIPDSNYTDRERLCGAFSIERIRAVITDILRRSANLEGNSCLDREEILKRIKEYPLYYIQYDSEMPLYTLLEHEKSSLFKEKFVIKTDFRENKVIYQLKELRKIEEAIETFIEKCLAKKYNVEKEVVEQLVQEDKKFFEEKNKIEYLNIEERQKAYQSALANGLFILTGKAGSGKTTAVINLIKKFAEQNKWVFVFTPTGKANLVIRKRLGKMAENSKIRLSTIHRFLYGGLIEFIKETSRGGEIFRIIELIGKILAGKWEFFEEFREIAKKWMFNNPKVLIIDEASMVDEVLLATLFSLINPETLEHLILVGDEKQLPPIGVGRPLVDIIYNLKRKGLEDRIVRLESNLRFPPSSKLALLSETFESDEMPIPSQIDEILVNPDKSLEVRYFSKLEELMDHIDKILYSIGGVKGESVFEKFVEIFESGGSLNLDKVQIIAPRRVGDYGTLKINSRVAGKNNVFLPGTKLICEKNIYFEVEINGRNNRILGLANGSIGYIERKKGYIHFDEFEELKRNYGENVCKQLINKVRGDIYFNTERKIDLGYAITIHKAQGSDFDYVILVIPEINPFITKELIYTGLTRAKEKMFILAHSSLRDNLPLELIKIWRNSEVDQRKTMLFEFKEKPRPYILEKDGEVLELRSKIEYIIAKTLSDLGIEFEYEPEELMSHHILPDFKITVQGITYYLEHLGNMDNLAYRERWFKKLEIYKKLGLEDRLITTSEAKVISDPSQNIKKIVEDIKAGKLKYTEGSYSIHHYEI